MHHCIARGITVSERVSCNSLVDGVVEPMSRSETVQWALLRVAAVVLQPTSRSNSSLQHASCSTSVAPLHEASSDVSPLSSSLAHRVIPLLASQPRKQPEVTSYGYMNVRPDLKLYKPVGR